MRRSSFRWACWVAALCCLFFLCSYLIDAHTRLTKAPTCQWQDVPGADDLNYSARYCWLEKRLILLRLYSMDGKLVAERTYSYPDLPEFTWTSDRLWYDTYPADAFIALPPSFWEHLRAGFP